MSEAKYTPGPWKLDAPGSALVTFCGVAVAKALDNCDTREETEANARLIAAAPKSHEANLAALKYLCDPYPRVDVRHEVIELLQAAIAQATGGEKV